MRYCGMPDIAFCSAALNVTSRRTGLSLPFKPPPMKSCENVNELPGGNTTFRDPSANPPTALNEETLFPLWVARNSSDTFDGASPVPYNPPGHNFRFVSFTHVCVTRQAF